MVVREQLIEFPLKKLLTCINSLGDTSNVVSSLYFLTKEHGTNVAPLETDGMAFVFPNESGGSEISEELVFDWILRKGFEDFITVLSQYLIEAYRLLRAHALTIQYTRDNPYLGKQSLEEMMEAIHTDALKKSVPELITEIETFLGHSLSLKDEILSINKVRNCLVHRGSIVHLKDTNNQEKASLNLKYLDLACYARTANGVEEVTKEFKERTLGIYELSLCGVPKEATFLIDQKVVINADIFKSVTFTLISFIHSLIHSLPLRDDIKSAFTPPMQVNLSFDQDRTL